MDGWPGMETDPEYGEPYPAGLGHAGQLTPDSDDTPRTRTPVGLVFEVFVGRWKLGLSLDLQDAGEVSQPGSGQPGATR